MWEQKYPQSYKVKKEKCFQNSGQKKIEEMLLVLQTTRRNTEFLTLRKWYNGWYSFLGTGLD